MLRYFVAVLMLRRVAENQSGRASPPSSCLAARPARTEDLRSATHLHSNVTAVPTDLGNRQCTFVADSGSSMGTCPHTCPLVARRQASVCGAIWWGRLRIRRWAVRPRAVATTEAAGHVLGGLRLSHWSLFSSSALSTGGKRGPDEGREMSHEIRIAGVALRRGPSRRHGRKVRS
jgi:hypothetical protein